MTKLFAKLRAPWRSGAVSDEFSRLAPLLLLVPPQMPPVGLLACIEVELDRLETRPALPSRDRSWQPVLLLLAWLAGAVAGAFGSAFFMRPQSPATCPPVRLAALQFESASTGVGIESIECGRYLRLSHAEVRVAEGQSLELSLVPRGGGERQSLGFIAAKGNSTVLPVSVALMAGDTLVLSREPAFGSREAGPNGPVIATARIGETQ